MNKLTIVLLFILQVTCLESFGQVPGITYQAVILSPEGKGLPGVNHTNIPLATQEICLRFSFLNQDGEKEYEEIIQTQTDPYGMVNVIIGKGEQVGGWVSSFDKIPWSMAAKFLEVSLDKSGSCSDFTAISKQEFTAVPFALFSVNSGATDSEVSQGKSAYQVWIDLGNVGSEQDFIKSLKGPAGPQGPAGATGPAGVTGAAGPQGPTGAAGTTGATGPAGNTGATGPAGTSGSNGLSAYQVWLQLGNTGTEANFIASLKGPTGAAGPQGPAGITGATGPAGTSGAAGPAGTSGSNGLSAYQVWLQLGNTGTEANFIASLKGPTGAAGPQGPAGITGATGPAGTSGAAGPAGTSGSNGLSAYQVWLQLGNTGTEANFIASLKGTTGAAGPQGPAGTTGATGPAGTSGAAGPAGTSGSNGLSAYQVWLQLGNTGTEANFIASLTGPVGPQGPTGAAGADGAAASAATFVDLSTDQTVGGTKIFTNPIAGSITGSSGSTSGNAATATLAAEATKLATPRAINGVAFDGSAPITVTAAAETLTGATLNATVTGSSLTSVGTLTDLTVTNPIAGSITGSSGSTSGNAATATLAAEATKLATPRAINGVAFDGSAPITVTAAAETLTGATLNATVTGSSLTSVGTLTDLTVTNPIAGSITGSSGSTSGNAATATLAAEATKLATPRAINGVAFDGSAPITVTAAAETLTGATLNATVKGSSLTSVGTLTDLTVTNPIAGSITGSSGSTSGNAATATLAAEATKLATPRAINGVAFDGSAPITVTAAAETLTGATLNATVTGSSLTSVGTLTDLTVTNPIAGSITGSSGSTSGNAATATLAAEATKLATPRAINGVAFDGSADISITSSADAATLTGTTLASNVVSSSLTSTGTLNKLEVTTTTNKISLFNNNSSSNKDISLKSTNGNILIETVNSAGKIFLKSALVGISGTNTAVGIGTQTPNSTSILELNSTTQGFLPPRMNDVQRDAISDPPSGLMIYCTNCGVNGGEPQYFNGNAWVNLTGGPAASAPTLRVGDDHLGGRIFYIYQSYDPGYIAGQVHGLIVAPVNLSTSAWGSSSTEDVSGTSSELNTGQANTTAIINFVGGSRNSSYAAERADSYTINSYSDWYLPSEKEMIKLIQSSISYSGSGWTGLTSLYGGYWTSTQYNATNATYVLVTGAVSYSSKIISKNVRPIKSF